MANADDDDDDSGGTVGINTELLKAYFEFGKRAVRAHWLLSSTLFVIGTSLAVVVAIYWPRTFACTTVLMASSNAVLDTTFNPTPLAGAADLILRHENLESIIKEVGLVKKNVARRSGVLKLKDRLMTSIAGPQDERMQEAILVPTVEAKLDVSTEQGDLTIKAMWSDGETAMELAEAARQSFVKNRHVTEMSAFEEKMAILNEHATKLRSDIAGFADQARAARSDRMKQVRGEAAAAREKAEKSDDAAAPKVARSLAPAAPAQADTMLPALTEKLATLKRNLADAEAERNRRLHDAQAKFEDMKLHLTASHPDVITQGERVSMLAQVPSEMALLQAEVKDVEGAIQQREGFAKVGGMRTITTLGSSNSRTGNADTLPDEVAALLRDDEGDPAITAQLSSAVTNFAMLRQELLSTRIDLDTAQAAFNHRYQVIVPAEVPQHAFKPKPGVIVAVGAIMTLLLAMILPILFEIKKGVLSERWQVELQLPVLAELHLPPHSGD